MSRRHTNQALANRRKIKDVLLGILEESGGEVGSDIRLNKIYRKALLNHLERTGDLLVRDHRMVKAPKGPIIDDRLDLYDELVRDGAITIRRAHRARVFVLQPEVRVSLSREERQSIAAAVRDIGLRPPEDISEETHGWGFEQTELGARQDIYVDLIDDDEREQILSSLDSEMEKLRRLFG